MNPNLELYAENLRAFTDPFDPSRGFELVYAIHAMRNYTQEKQPDGRTVSTPQVRPEGALRMICPDPAEGKLHVLHTRSWSTWTGQEHAVKQDLQATVSYQPEDAGPLTDWKLEYASTPVLPVKSFQFDALSPMAKSGSNRNGMMTLSSAPGIPPQERETRFPLVSLYSLIERIQQGDVARQQVDYLDDLTHLRPGLTLRPLEPEAMRIDGKPVTLGGAALTGPALMPLFFWRDPSSRVIAIVGHNVAITLVEGRNFS